jgi:hypothetical protein
MRRERNQTFYEFINVVMSAYNTLYNYSAHIYYIVASKSIIKITLKIYKSIIFFGNMIKLHGWRGFNEI